ncbi:MAG: 3-dehydroquinate synthase [Holophagaceae bacterium]|nr:3-dehydroquinate synthase [Holophagaceae bacterium]
MFLETPCGFPTKVVISDEPHSEYLPTTSWILLGDISVRSIWQSFSLPEPPVTMWVETSEATKRIETIVPWLEHWAACNIHRNYILVVVGGGIMTDMGGLAASLYSRGIPWHSWPTSLLGQIDAGIGGKTGVNLDSGKNLAGTFHHPEQTVVFVKFLDSLSQKHQKSGMWELVKMALIEGDLSRAESLLECEKLSTEDIKWAIALKIGIVHQDFREKGHRRLLNLGHTFGHALEAASNHSLLHGEAVGLGLLMACLLSENNKIASFPNSFTEKMANQLAPLSQHIPAWGKCIPFLLRDKKNEDGGKVHFIIPIPGTTPVQQKFSPESLESIHAKLLMMTRPH